MPVARLCLDCGKVTRATRCPPCAAQHGAPRAAYKAQRYDAEYDDVRRTWAPTVALGCVPCSRCDAPIVGPWDLDHHPTKGLWPAHPTCNRAAH